MVLIGRTYFLRAFLFVFCSCSAGNQQSDISDIQRSAPTYGENIALFQSFLNGRSVVNYVKCRDDVKVSRTCSDTPPITSKHIEATAYFKRLHFLGLSTKEINEYGRILHSSSNHTKVDDFPAPMVWNILALPFSGNHPQIENLVWGKTYACSVHCSSVKSARYVKVPGYHKEQEALDILKGICPDAKPMCYNPLSIKPGEHSDLWVMLRACSKSRTINEQGRRSLAKFIEYPYLKPYEIGESSKTVFCIK